jgi:hypothetical protein
VQWGVGGFDHAGLSRSTRFSTVHCSMALLCGTVQYSTVLDLEGTGRERARGGAVPQVFTAALVPPAHADSAALSRSHRRSVPSIGLSGGLRRHALLDTGAELEPLLKPPTASAACATELQIIAGLDAAAVPHLHCSLGSVAPLPTSALGVGSPLSTSAPARGLGSPLPHLHRDWAHCRSRGRSGIAQCGAWLQHKRRR